MKLNNIFTMLAAAFTLTFVGCQEPERFLDEVKVSKSYIAFSKDGGDVKVQIDATAEWSIVAWDNENAKEVELPEWLTITPMSGGKGANELTFTASATTETREQMLHLNCSGAYQILNVMQVTEKQETPLSNCNEVLTAGVVDKFYRIKGVVTEIPLADFQKYGKFYITDDSTSESVQIYGCANKAGFLDASNNPTIAVGDIVTIEGSWSKYGNFNNDTQILEVEKSLIKIEKVSPATALSKDGDVFTVTLTNKGEGFEITIPEADAAWLTAGEPLVLGTTVVVEVTVAANESTPRKSSITFSTVSGGNTYQATAEIEQEGGIPQLSVAEAIALPAKSWFAVAGTVTGIHKKGFIVTDEAGDAIYAYTNTTEDQLGATLGDNVIVTGKIDSYGNFYQIAEPQVEVVSSGNKITYGLPVTLDSAASFEAYKEGAFSAVYIEASGITTGQYGDITIGDWVVSPYQTSSTINISDFADKKVRVKGYLLQFKSPNILRVMLTSVEIDNVIYEESFAAGIGKYTIDNKSLGTLTKEVWNHDPKMYMKGSGYGGGDGVESWLVSPVYDLAGQTAVFLSFDHILNYLKGAPREDHVNVLVKEEDASDWAVLSGITWPEGANWNPVNSGKVDLSAYAGKKIQIAFKYTTAGGNATTWEVYNVKLTLD